MASADIHSSFNTSTALQAVTISTATLTIGVAADTLNFEGIEYLFHLIDVSDGTFSMFLQDSDEPSSNFFEVDQKFLIGTEKGTEFIDFANGGNAMLGYIGGKKFVRPVIRTVGGTISGEVLVLLLVDSPSRSPINPNVTPI